jgi:CubicO group peptidase (beta-lactamase class C family)
MNYRKVSLLVLAFALVLVLAGCRTSPADLPPIGEGAVEISRFLEDAVEAGRVPGLVALVTDRSGIVYHEAFGKQNVAADFDMDRDTIFRIYSMTKPITSVGVMMLVDEGLIGLDDPVSRYLPGLANPQVLQDVDLVQGTWSSRPASGEITIRQLLTHTSGLGYAFSSPILYRLLDLDQRATELPLLDDPGARWIYGESTRVLGEVIEVASGQLLDTFMRNRIFRPLGMDETGFVVLEDRIPRLATTHQRQGGVLEEAANPEPPVYFEVRGDSRLTTTASDYARFLRMLLNEGQADGSRLLDPATAGLMRVNQIGELRVESQPVGDPAATRPFPLGAGRDTFGLGFQITGAGGGPNTRSPGSYSWSGLQNTHFWVDPVEGVAGILFMQVLPFYDEAAIEILQGFEERVYRSLD